MRIQVRRLSNLGHGHALSAGRIADRAQNRPAEAWKEFEEALKTYRELAQKNPETYLPVIAEALGNMGILDSDQNRPDEARKKFEEALKIFHELAQKDPET